MFLRRFPQVRTDFPALIDEWASRFFEELDYIKEGNNGIRFSEFMAKELPQVCQQLLFAPLIPVKVCVKYFCAPYLAIAVASQVL